MVNNYRRSQTGFSTKCEAFSVVDTDASRGITPVVIYWVTLHASVKSPDKSLPVKLNNLLHKHNK